ncbi:hypothetical protein, partial [Paraburkholderia sp. J67]|uniref:hypothetical protein n=1 Tax=Paraburkholderia sp. J67 TaxID=2805435 RepID=UPI002ABE5BAC
RILAPTAPPRKGARGNKSPALLLSRPAKAKQHLSITPIAISAIAHIVKVRYKIRTVTMQSR